ncbi:MAG TPA: DUF5916 domain-containing protein, partial [Gemmatimonadaceae bacterium]|nr:DUF5916 domain-containing protein [Gemmatimonadaceae bacterium]
RPSATATATTTNAFRVKVPPAIDGADADDAWRGAQRIEGFRVFDPVEDGTPTMPTEARIAYDDRNLYVFVRAFDPHPDSIMALLSRRDERTPSDYIRVIVDSYHDKRTGYEFMVNPAGVQRDMYLFNDSNEDITWNAVWDVKTAIDSLGWTAEFRIPLSQLRYPRKDTHTFGIGIHREVARLNERSSWPLWRRSQFGIASQLGEVQGLVGISSPRRLEVMPYTVQANDSKRREDGYGRAQRMALGADLKYGISSNLTLDATINPDFGQVEADPGVLNLGAFEQFFEERRPFFLEGMGIFRYDVDCNDGQCTGPFYSRRIGRSPQAGFLSADPNAVPLNSTILGAAKVTGRLSNGLSLGILDAVTGRESVAESLTVEPRTNYFVARAQQDLRGGRSGLGVIVTAVNRELDGYTERYLRREAYTAGVDARHRFGRNGMYELTGQLFGSLVRGSEEAIARTQRSAVHLYQRPDDDFAYDSTRTSLTGSGAGIGLSKNGGLTRFYTGLWYKGPGLEINDVGFMQNANNMGQSNWFALVFQQPKWFYRRWQVNFNQWNVWTADGLNTGHGGNVNMNGQLRNMWFVYAGFGGETGSHCVACLRGGPALWENHTVQGWAGFTGDQRRAVYGAFNAFVRRTDDGRSFHYNLGPSLQARLASSFSTSLGLSVSRNTDDRQWLGNFGATGSDTTHYTVARLRQKTVAVTTRLNWTASPTLSLQVYAQPFVTGGEFSDWREVAAPRARAYADRFRPYAQGGDPGGFNFKQFRSNTVLRWEYRPGSTLFFVWAQGRLQDGIDAGSFRFNRDYRNLFSAHPDNTFLVKASYWFSM